MAELAARSGRGRLIPLMPKSIARLIVFLLVPALVADPATASTLLKPFSYAPGEIEARVVAHDYFGEEALGFEDFFTDPGNANKIPADNYRKAAALSRSADAKPAAWLWELLSDLEITLSHYHTHTSPEDIHRSLAQLLENLNEFFYWIGAPPSFISTRLYWELTKDVITDALLGHAGEKGLGLGTVLVHSQIEDSIISKISEYYALDGLYSVWLTVRHNFENLGSLIPTVESREELVQILSDENPVAWVFLTRCISGILHGDPTSQMSDPEPGPGSKRGVRPLRWFTQEKQRHYAELAGTMKAELRLLRPRLARVIRQHFHDDKSLVEIGNKLGVNKERARQLIDKALRILGKASDNLRLSPFLDGPMALVLGDPTGSLTPDTESLRQDLAPAAAPAGFISAGDRTTAVNVIQTMMRRPENERITLVVNTPFTQSYRAALGFLNSGRGNIVALKGPPGVFDEFYSAGYPKAIQVPDSVLNEAGFQMPADGIIDPMTWTKNQRAAQWGAHKERVQSLKARIRNFPLKEVNKFERDKFTTLKADAQDTRKVRISEDLTVHANAPIFDLRVKDKSGHIRTVRTFENCPVLSESVDILSVGPETLKKWGEIISGSQGVIVIGDPSPFISLFAGSSQHRILIDPAQSNLMNALSKPEIWEVPAAAPDTDRVRWQNELGDAYSEKYGEDFPAQVTVANQPPRKSLEPKLSLSMSGRDVIDLLPPLPQGSTVRILENASHHVHLMAFGPDGSLLSVIELVTERPNRRDRHFPRERPVYMPDGDYAYKEILRFPAASGKIPLLTRANWIKHILVPWLAARHYSGLVIPETWEPKPDAGFELINGKLFRRLRPSVAAAKKIRILNPTEGLIALKETIYQLASTAQARKKECISIIIDGESRGSGKSTLVSAMVDALHIPGWDVQEGTGYTENTVYIVQGHGAITGPEFATDKADSYIDAIGVYLLSTDQPHALDPRVARNADFIFDWRPGVRPQENEEVHELQEFWQKPLPTATEPPLIELGASRDSPLYLYSRIQTEVASRRISKKTGKYLKDHELAGFIARQAQIDPADASQSVLINAFRKVFVAAGTIENIRRIDLADFVHRLDTTAHFSHSLSRLFFLRPADLRHSRFRAQRITRPGIYYHIDLLSRPKSQQAGWKAGFVHEVFEQATYEAGLVDRVFLEFLRHNHFVVLEGEIRFASLLGKSALKASRMRLTDHIVKLSMPRSIRLQAYNELKMKIPEAMHKLEYLLQESKTKSFYESSRWLWNIATRHTIPRGRYIDKRRESA